MVDQSLIDQINMGEAREHAEGDEFIIDGRPIPAASMQATGTGRFEGKVTFGDYTKDSDNLMSSWILSNWSGGGLINHHIEGATDNRFKWATAWTMSAEQLALPPKKTSFDMGTSHVLDDGDGQGAVSRPLVEAFNGIYFSFGVELWKLTGDRYTLTNLTWTKIGDLAFKPTNLGVQFSDTQIAIPTEGGTQFVDSSGTISAISPDQNTVVEDVLAWDNKLYVIEGFGAYQLRVYQPDTGAWDPANPDMAIPAGEWRGTPRLFEFWDRAGDPCVAIATADRLWLYDASGEIILPSTLRIPFHHNNGLAADAWRDDAAYYSAGLGVMRYTRDGVRTDVGLDRDDGLPDMVVGGSWNPTGSTDVRNHTILDFYPAYNFLAAAVNLGVTQGAQDGVEGYQVHSKIMAWNEAGWHCLADTDRFCPETDEYVRFSGTLLATSTVGGYRLWWGEVVARTDVHTMPWGGANTKTIPAPAVHSIEMPRAFHGPRQKVLSTIGAFEPDGVFYTGWFDSGMRGFYKTWSHLEVYLTDPGDGEDVGGYVDVSYRTSESKEWQLLGTADTYGQNVLPFGVDADGFERGETSRQIEFRLDLHSDVETRSPIVNSLILKYIKLPLEGTAWLANIELDSENMKNLGPREIYAYLASLTSEGGFSKMIHHRGGHRVRAAQVQAVEGMADNPFMRATVNLIEVPINRDEDM